MKTIKILIIALLAILVCSCNDEDIEEATTPTFTLTSFSKEDVNNEYHCKATIEIKGLIEDYSIDGLLYAEDIRVIGLNLPYKEDMLSDVHWQKEGVFYFSYYGKHKGDLTLELEWYSLEDRDTYLVGWHLCYGYGADCTLLMIDLDTHLVD